MHTYRSQKGGWQVGYNHGDDLRFDPVGPAFELECEAAAFTSFLNGGRYCPDEIAPIFAVHREPQDEDDSIHPDRPKSFDNDYPLERKRG